MPRHTAQRTQAKLQRMHQSIFSIQSRGAHCIHCLHEAALRPAFCGGGERGEGISVRPSLVCEPRDDGPQADEAVCRVSMRES
jgi:hypothetical protein